MKSADTGNGVTFHSGDNVDLGPSHIAVSFIDTAMQMVSWTVSMSPFSAVSVFEEGKNNSSTPRALHTQPFHFSMPSSNVCQSFPPRMAILPWRWGGSQSPLRTLYMPPPRSCLLVLRLFTPHRYSYSYSLYLETHLENKCTCVN